MDGCIHGCIRTEGGEPRIENDQSTYLPSQVRFLSCLMGYKKGALPVLNGAIFTPRNDFISMGFARIIFTPTNGVLSPYKNNWILGPSCRRGRWTGHVLNSQMADLFRFALAFPNFTQLWGSAEILQWKSSQVGGHNLPTKQQTPLHTLEKGEAREIFALRPFIWATT